jgi:hypothetical protein
VLGLELGQLLLDAEAGGDGEGAGVIAGRCDEVGQALLRLAVGALLLLAQAVPGASAGMPSRISSA